MKRLSLALIVLSAVAGLGWIAVQEAPYMRLARAIELFGMVVRELNEQYVESIETDQLTYEAIEHMLSKLDPYTEFYREEQTSDLDFLLQGRYIGVGIRLGMLDSLLTVMSVTDGTSAHRAGVRQGDVVLRIDSIDAAQKEVNQVRKYLRGPLGTVVRMQLQRGDDTIKVELRREEILVRNVTYVGMLPGNIALVRLERFSRRAPEEFRLALDSLRTVSELRGLVVDIRDNPGACSMQRSASRKCSFVPAIQSLRRERVAVLTSAPTLRGQCRMWTRRYRSLSSSTVAARAQAKFLPVLSKITIVRSSSVTQRWGRGWYKQ